MHNPMLLAIDSTLDGLVNLYSAPAVIRRGYNYPLALYYSTAGPLCCGHNYAQAVITAQA